MKKSNGVRVYKTYHFVDQDPIVSKIRTAVEEEAAIRGISVSAMANKACHLSRVAVATKNNWYSRKTKRPQFATLMAFARAIDRELYLGPRGRR